MTDVLLLLTMPKDVAQHIEDLLLDRPDLVSGFTAMQVTGHGSAVRLIEANELVRGHAPRIQIQIIGAEAAMRAVLALIQQELPRAHVFFCLLPAIDTGHL